MGKANLMWIAVIIAFLIGLIMPFEIQVLDYQIEKPSPFFSKGEKEMPYDRVKDLSIRAENDRITIFAKNPILAKFEDTGSMEPLLGSRSTGIEIVPKSSSEIKKGDIISFESGNERIIHRVVETGKDSEGWYAITKGDNNAFRDPEKIRFSQVKGILIGVLY